MKAAHAGLNLKDIHFNAVAGHLHSTLVELHVPDDLINEVMTVAGSTHDDIVC